MMTDAKDEDDMESIVKAHSEGEGAQAADLCPYPMPSILALAWEDGRDFRRRARARAAAKAKRLASFGPAGPCQGCNGLEMTEAPVFGVRCNRCKGSGIEPIRLHAAEIEGWRVHVHADRFYIDLFCWEIVPVLQDGTEGVSQFGGSVGGRMEAALLVGRTQLKQRGLVEISMNESAI